MKQHTTAQRLQHIMNVKQMRQVDIIEAAAPYCKKYGISLGKNALSQYVAGKVVPGQQKLTILGLALGVSEAWLMGYDVPMERSIAPTVENNGRIVEFMDLFSLLSAEQQMLVINQIKGILSNQ